MEKWSEGGNMMKKNIGCRITIITLLVCALLITVSFSAVAFPVLEESTIENEEVEDDDTETQSGSQRINRLESPNMVEAIDEVHIDPPEEEEDDSTPGTVTYPSNPWDSSVSADYLILTSNDFISSSSINSLANWRAKYNGFDVAVVSINDVGYGNNQNGIKNYIRFVLQNWDIEYLLIVGDTEHVDSSHHLDDLNDKWYVSDLWYGCFQDIGDGQYEGDDDYSTINIKVGRFCVDNQDELNVIVDKTIQ